MTPATRQHDARARADPHGHAARQDRLGLGVGLLPWARGNGDGDGRRRAGESSGDFRRAPKTTARLRRGPGRRGEGGGVIR